LLLLVLASIAASCTGGGGLDPRDEDSPAAQEPDPARLSARPRAHPDAAAGAAGLRELGSVTATPTYLFAPPSYRATRPAPLVLALHGAGGNGGRVIRPLQEFARTTGAVLLAPTSTGTSWDLMRGGIGPDVQSVDKALRHVFRRYAIDARRVAVYGFSDGASYALTLGTANGDLFSSVIALSPGGYAVASPRGQPEIFIAHGTNDRALPIESTSEVIVPRLREAGYRVVFRRHPGGHDVPPRRDEALSWLTDRWRAATTRSNGRQKSSG
jgi:phospholipase/carboxylesterase